MLGRGGAAPWMWCCSPPSTPLFIGRRGKGADPSRWDLEGGAAREGGLAPQARGGAPLRVSPPNPRRMGPRWGARPALQGLAPSPLRPMWPSGRGGPSRWTPGTPPVAPVQYR